MYVLEPQFTPLSQACNFTEDELRAQFITPETGLIFQSVTSSRLCQADN
jgi:hypothetical protein